VKNIFLKATREGRVFDVVFNNAGIGFIALIYEQTTNQIRKIVYINVLGMVMITK